MTRVTRGSRRYANFYDGKKSIISDNEYQQRLSKMDVDYLIQQLATSLNLERKKVDTSGTSSKSVYCLKENSANIEIYIDVLCVKNSGQDADRKRLQIHSNYYGFCDGKCRDDKKHYFFLGLYPHSSSGDCVYVLLENDGVSLNPLQSYSSLWIDFESIVAAATNGIYFAVNKRNYNKYTCFTKKYAQLVLEAIAEDDYSNIINSDTKIHFIDDKGRESAEPDVYVEDYNPSKDAVVTPEGKAKIKKNAALRDVSFIDAKYTCALCGKDYTFMTNNEKMYFEAHHLIPCNINIQKRFKKKLDHTLNLFCLCPECHRKIHLIRNSEVSELLNTLYNTRKERFADVYNLDIDQLVDIYKKIDRKDEESM